jgi:hypothetical protein
MEGKSEAEQQALDAKTKGRVEAKKVTLDVNSGHETFFHAATCLA